MMENKKQEITFKLERIENLEDSQKEKIKGLNPDQANGLVIKEYRSGSFVKMSRFLPLDDLFTAQVNTQLTEGDRGIVTETIMDSLEF